MTRLGIGFWLGVAIELAGCAAGSMDGPPGAPLESGLPSNGSASANAASAPVGTASAAAVPGTQTANPPAVAAGSMAAAGAMVPAADDGVTFHRSIRPILDARCMGCHFDGGAAAAYAFTDWAKVSGLAPAMVQAVTDRRMPPWLADTTDCTKLRDDQRLSDAQVELFQTWQAAGFPEGDPTTYVAPTVAAQQELGPPTIVTKAATPYALRPNFEVYACVQMQSFTEDTYVTAIDLLPEHEAVVHHAIANISGACDALGGGNIYSYRPGASTVTFGPESALLIPAGSRLAVQFHYNTMYMGNDIPATDNSEIRLWTLPAGQTPTFLITRYANHNFNISIPVGATNQPVASTIAATQAMNPPGASRAVPAEIIGITPHMHALGVAFNQTLHAADGDRCLVQVPRWDWEWQFDYFFDPEAAIPVQSGDRIEQTCMYSNLPENQLTGENGERLAPKATSFGEGTRDEMCLGYIWMRYKWADIR